MGQIAYRANLSAATFPMTIADGGRTVIVPGPDQNFDRRVDPEGEQKDAGIPQTLYMENVLPTSNGYQSVGFLKSTTGITVGGTFIWDVAQIFSVRPTWMSGEGKIVNLPLFQSNAGAYTAGPHGNYTVSFSGTALGTNEIVTSAVVNSLAYVYGAASQQIYTSAMLGASTVSLINVTATVTPLNFFTTSDIGFILSSNNYLIAVSIRDGRVYWSSLTTPLDFTASLVSGAGSLIPNNIRGEIIGAQVSGDGYYIYTTEQSIFAQYTGNARYPFKFTQVKEYDGLLKSPQTFHVFDVRTKAYDGSYNFNGNVAVSATGEIRYIRQDQASAVMLDVDNFLRNQSVQEQLDFSTNVFTPLVTYTKYPSVSMWGSRYIVVSINDPTANDTSQYTHAFVYDVNGRRLGKLKVRHKFTCAFSDYNSIGFVDVADRVVRYMQLDIYNQRVEFSPNVIETAQGALLLGKFQYIRQRVMQMEEIEIEGPQNTAITPTPNFSVALLPSADGRNFDAPVSLTPRSVQGGLVTYDCHITARNHSILLKGAFSVNTLQLKFVPGGER